MFFPSHAAQNLRYAIRGLRRSPGMALTAILAIAIGIGASTAIFSVVDRILFRSLPYAQEDHLVVFGLRAPIEPREFMLGADYLEWKAAQQPFQSMAAYGFVHDCDLTQDQPLRMSCLDVESSLLPTLGTPLWLGRNFTAEEDRSLAQPPGPPLARPGPSAISNEGEAPRAALISYALWRGRFGSDRAVVGHTISLDGHDVRLVGVLRRDFELPNLLHADVLVPLALNPVANRHPNTGRVLRTVARLKPGITAAQAQQALAPLFADSLRYVPAQFVNEVKLSVRTLRERQMGEARRPSQVLLAAVVAVLLIACANVANLLLARSAARARERAVRSALGAARGRLAMEALAESLVLAFSGGAAGLALAYVLLRAIIRLNPQGIPRLEQASLDLRVVLFALACCAGSAILFGIAPALEPPNPQHLAAAHSVGRRGSALRFSLVAAQIALSLVLLSGAALLLRSLRRMQAEPLGISSEHVLTASLTLGPQRYPTAERISAFYADLEQRLRRLPGIDALAISDSLPPMGPMRSRIFAAIAVDGRPRFRQGTGGMVGWRAVTPEYFKALRIPMVEGRGFLESDRAPAANAIIVNQTLRRRLFGEQNPINQRLAFEGPTVAPLPANEPWFTVVGVAADARNNGIEEAAGPEYYVVRRDVPQDATSRSSILIRTSLSPQAVSSWVRAEVASIDPALPVQMETMQQRVGKLMAGPRFNATLLAFFALSALLLAAIGLYGVMAFLVAQHTSEIGVRMALGATPGRIAALMLGRALRWTAAGAIIGFAGALALSHLIEKLLYRTAPRDPSSLTISLLLLVAVAIAAAFFPARRAASVDPMVALRHD
ncbi:MAG: ABC transporter permease [Acidobacteria bacterium]|nr:ABC transporter permease [Acidobacteriota bacterium]